MVEEAAVAGAQDGKAVEAVKTSEAAEAADEHTFVFPAGWRRLVYARRGGVPGPSLSPDAEPGAELIRAAKSTIQSRLAHPASDPALVAAAEAYLADPATGPATGAGAVAGLVGCDLGWTHTDHMSKVADAVVATRGVVFAAQAVLHATGLEFGGYWNNGRQVEPCLTRGTRAGWGYFPHWVALAGRVRAYLAVAPHEEYEAAIAAVEVLRPQSSQCRVAASFLLPTQQSWVDADCAALAQGGDHFVGKLLWCSATTAGQFDLIAPYVDGWWGARDSAALATAADGAGAVITPQLLSWFDDGSLDADAQQRVLSTLANLPTDAAFAGLVARLDRKYVPLAALEAARRFPRRALRLLAAHDGQAAADMLRSHVMAHQDLVADELELMPPAARARVEAILAKSPSLPEAPPEVLPPVLVTPPWTVKRAAARPTVVAGLDFAEGPAMAWAAGERETWAARQPPHADWWKLGTSIDDAVERFKAGDLKGHHEVTLMLTGPSDQIARLLPGWRPGRVWDADQWMPPIIARYGLAALPATLHLAGKLPATCTALLMPYASAEVTGLMADAFARLKSLRSLAIAWFDRHAAYAARVLTPQALGKPGATRRAAEESLRMIALRHRDDVMAAADTFGPQARAGLEALLGADPLHMLPTRIPTLPAWAQPSLLPRVLLADRSSALGDEAVRHLCTMLAISKPGEVYAGVPLVRDLCDRASLAEFAWALFRQWQSVGTPSKQAWPLHALRWLGDDETVRRLSPVIRAWPGEGGHAKALIGLEVLAEIGSDLALMHLHGIAQKAKFKGLKDRATEKMAEVAAGLGLTADQLADRLVPDLGLTANGSLTLDYGPRRFVVGFDEQLKPYVTDETGARRKDLPKPGARDDQRLAPAAYQRFSALKKDVRTVAADQIRRLEAAMVTQRRWSAGEFRDYFVRHPLLWHIIRRLVWTATVDGEQPTAFRVAEDRTYADVADEGYALPTEATIGLAHPLHLAGQVAAWSELFADYEILQPFPQLGRTVYELTPAERQAPELTRFAGLSVPTTTVLGLERRGWRRGEPQDAGIQGWMWRATPDGRAVVVDLDPGIPVGAPDILPEQQIAGVWINGVPSGGWRPRQPHRAFGDLDAVTASEMLRDLTEVLAR
jgi:hypothetical protein